MRADTHDGPEQMLHVRGLIHCCSSHVRRSWNSVLQRTAGPYKWHICDLWRRLNEGCLRQLSGSVATAPRGPGLTPRRHWRTKFAVMHNRSSNNVLRYGPLTEGEPSEATRIYWSRRWHGGVAVICARAAAIDARNRISQLEVSGNRRGDAGCRPPRPRGKRLHRGQQSGDRVSLCRSSI